MAPADTERTLIMAAQTHCKNPVAPKGNVAMAAESVPEVRQRQCQHQQDIVVRVRGRDGKAYVPRRYGVPRAAAAIVVWDDTDLIAR